MAIVTLVHYGAGNIQAFANIYHRLGVDVEIARTPEQLRRARRLILPGVGAFDWAMGRLNGSGLRETLDDLVQRRGVPVLGVCVGMQMMAESSTEGVEPGLGWIEADVGELTAPPDSRLGLPHMGWNHIMPRSADDLFRGLEAPRFYFLHSYALRARRPEDILATADYGGPFAAAVRRGSVFGTQFHPEKSHGWGIGVLKNFGEL